jgi:hypothetical protein
MIKSIRRSIIILLVVLNLVSAKTGILVLNSESLSSYDQGFLGVCSKLFPYEIIGLNDIINRTNSLSNYDVIVCNIFAPLSQVSLFDDPVVEADIQNAYSNGVNFILGISGAKILEKLGYAQTTVETWGPAYDDSFFINSINVHNPITQNLDTFPDINNYSLSELHTIDHSALIWRVQSGYYPEIVHLRESSISITPQYLIKMSWTTFNVEGPVDKLYFWDNDTSKILFIMNLFWTEDNDNFLKGYIGNAGQQILLNAVNYFSNSNLVFYEGFEGNDVGVIPAGWNMEWSDVGTLRTVDNPVYAGNRAVRIQGITSWAQGIYKPNSFYAGDQIVKFALYIPTDTEAGHYPVYFTYAGIALNFEMFKPDSFNVLCNWSDVGLNGFEAGQWYIFEIHIDWDKRIFQVVQGNKKSYVRAFNEYRISTSGYGLDISLYGNNQNGHKTGYFDEISINAIPVDFNLNLPVFHASSDTLYFDSVKVGQTGSKILTISNLGSDTLKIFNLQIQNPVFSTDLSDITIPPNSDHQLQITFSPEDTLLQLGTLTFLTNDSNNTNVNIIFHGKGALPHLSTISQLNFGFVPVDSIHSLNLTLINDSKVELNISSMAMTGSNFTFTDISPTVINAGNSKTLKIDFKPDSVGNFSGKLQIYSDDPNSPTIVNLTGIGSKPAISSPSVIHFGELSDVGNISFYIKNSGNGDLSIYSITSSNQRFKILNNFPINILPADSTEISIEYSPEIPGLDSTNFHIQSNAGTKDITGYVYIKLANIDLSNMRLDFGKVDINIQKTFPLVIKNEGTATVNVSNVITNSTKFSTSFSNSVSILPGDSLVIDVYFMSDYPSRYEDTLKILNDSKYPIIPVPMTAEAIDTIPPVFEQFTQVSLLTQGQYADVSAAVKENSNYYKLLLNYKFINESNYNVIELQNNEPYRLVVGENALVPLEYYFLARDSAHNETSTSRQVINIKLLGDGFTVPMNKYGNDVSNYVIFSFPASLNDEPLLKKLEDDLGPYDKEKWRAFYYKNGSNIELGEQGFINYQIGQGFWLISKDPVNKIDTGPCQTENVPSDSFIVINLEKGWNQIGNPYPFDLDWSYIYIFNNNSLIGQYKTFESGFKQSNVIKQFSGGFVFAEENTNLKIPPSARSLNNNNNQIALNKKNNNDKDFEVAINVKDETTISNIYGFGFNKDALETKDKMDEILPPVPPELYNIYFEHQDYFYPKFCKDIVPEKENYIWKLKVNTRRELVFNWKLSNLKEEKVLKLYNPYTYDIIDMRKDTSYIYNKIGKGELWFIYGDLAFVNSQTVPDEFILKTNYPNPFNLSTTIEFGVPAKFNGAYLKLLIFNVLGEIVREYDLSNISQGLHKITWNGRDNYSKTVSSGIYFYRMILNGKDQKISKTKKMILIK